MPKKHTVSRSRAYRLQLERLEERSMLAADVDVGFEGDFFDWSQFDEAAWFDLWTADVADFGDQPLEDDLSWLFEDGFEESWPAEPDALPEEPVGDDAAAAATGEVWEITDAETPDVAILEEPLPEEPLAEDTVIEEAVIEEPLIEEPLIEEPVIDEPVIDEPVIEEPVIEEPVIEEPVIEEPVIEEELIEEPVVEEREPEDWEYLLLSDGSSDETADDGFEWDVDDEWADPLPPEGDDGQAPSDDEIASAGEESVSPVPDLPFQTTATSEGSAAPRQAGFSARSAAFAAMRMFSGFSFSAPSDAGEDGPFFAGGRRRSRR